MTKRELFQILTRWVPADTSVSVCAESPVYAWQKTGGVILWANKACFPTRARHDGCTTRMVIDAATNPDRRRSKATKYQRWVDEWNQLRQSNQTPNG
jgi:hypothetical protein